MRDALNFPVADKRKFAQRIIRKRFDADEHFEIIQQKIDRMGDSFIKLSSAYIRNNIFGIIRQSNYFYEGAIKLIADITMILKESHDQMPQEARQRFIKQVNSLEKYVDHLRQIKKEWKNEFSESNNPDFNVLIKMTEEKFTDILERVEKTNRLDKSLSNHKGVSKL